MSEATPRIRVVSGYSGQRISGRYIAEGDYDLDDPLLLGESAFLLESGRAVELDRQGNPKTLTVTEGRADRDLAGKPIVVPQGQDQGQVSNIVAPVFALFPNNADASEVIQPYEIGSTEPAVVAGSEHKLDGTVSAKPERVARQEAAVTDAAVEEAEAVREHAQAAAEAAGEEAPSGDEDRLSGMNLDALRDEARRLDLQPLDDEGNPLPISKAKRAQLETALRDAEQ